MEVHMDVSIIWGKQIYRLVAMIMARQVHANITPRKAHSLLFGELESGFVWAAFLVQTRFQIGTRCRANNISTNMALLPCAINHLSLLQHKNSTTCMGCGNSIVLTMDFGR